MPDKITAKNLTYNASLPPFLARLHAQAAGSSDLPDPILAARQRPKAKARSASEEAQDEPVVVDEHGNVVDPQWLRAGGSEEAIADTNAHDGVAGAEDKAQRGARMDGSSAKKQKSATFGIAARKRKSTKVFGTDDGDDGDDGDVAGDMSGVREDTKRPQRPAQETAVRHEKATGEAPPRAKPKPKKGKKIKLSFADEGD